MVPVCLVFFLHLLLRSKIKQFEILIIPSTASVGLSETGLKPHALCEIYKLNVSSAIISEPGIKCAMVV